ncbi:MAG: hypothetical protein HONBIEJF_02622 [Fimbriimonadaceae bacterium]|nr:hypothetical protein [Fimbriimonadaceae bacterium]
MRWIALFGMVGLIIASFLVPPAKNFPEPELARIIFFHLPCAFATVAFVIFAAFCAWKYLVSKDWIWESRTHAATELSMSVAVATMVTGILFSKVQWGAWWHWDPRQTSFLIVLLLLGAYFAIRMSFEDEITRAKVSCAYSTLTLLPILFLFFVFPRLPQVLKNSLHPSTTVQSGGFSPDYWMVVMGIFVILMGMCIWLYKLHVRTSLLEQRLKDLDGNLEIAGDGPTAYRVDSGVHVRESR